MLSIVIPAHNEEQLLPGTLAALRDALATVDVEHEIIVSCDSCTDRTPQIARDAGARTVEVQVRQIAGARNAGARAAHGDILLFVDADTHARPNPLRQALAAIDAGAVGGGALIEFEGEIPWWSRIMLPPIMFLFRTFRYCGGCFLFCRRDAFEAVGGFDETYFASEEIHLARALKGHGRFVIVPDLVVTSGRKLRTFTGYDILRMLLRAITRPSIVRQRDKMDMWYGPKAREPVAAEQIP